MTSVEAGEYSIQSLAEIGVHRAIKFQFSPTNTYNTTVYNHNQKSFRVTGLIKPQTVIKNRITHEACNI